MAKINVISANEKKLIEGNDQLTRDKLDLQNELDEEKALRMKL